MHILQTLTFAPKMLTFEKASFCTAASFCDETHNQNRMVRWTVYNSRRAHLVSCSPERAPYPPKKITGFSLIRPHRAEAGGWQQQEAPVHQTRSGATVFSTLHFETRRWHNSIFFAGGAERGREKEVVVALS